MVLKRHARGRVERERVGNTSIDMKVSKRKRGSMNEAYKTVLVDGLKQKIDTNKDNILEQDDDYVLGLRRVKDVEKWYGVVGEREKCRAAKKRKRKGNVGELVDDSDIEEIDAHYELVLRHLKEGGKEHRFYPKHRRRNRCVAENLRERVHPAQGGERNKAQSRRKSKEVAGCATVVKGDHECFERQMNLVRKDKKTDRINVVKKEKSYLYGLRSKRVKEWPLEHANKAQSSKTVTEKVQGQRYRQQLNKGKKAVGEDGAGKRKAVMLLDHDHFHHKRIQEKILPMEYGCKHAARAQPVKKCKEQIIGGELKGVVKEEVKKENDKTELMKVVRGDSGIASKKTVFVTVKKEPDHCVETDVHIKGIQSQIRCVNCAKPVPAEVEILDSDIFIKKRILSPFVPNQLHYSMLEEESSKHHHLPNASDVFRKEVLKALREPYNKEEHQTCREVMHKGSYTKHYPGLRTILAKYRCQRLKRLVIIRGFVFWLRNLTREGAFRPWEDEECLAVEISCC